MERRHFITVNLACQWNFSVTKWRLSIPTIKQNSASLLRKNLPWQAKFSVTKWRFSIPTIKQNSAILLRKNLRWKAKFSVTKSSYFAREWLKRLNLTISTVSTISFFSNSFQTSGRRGPTISTISTRLKWLDSIGPTISTISTWLKWMKWLVRAGQRSGTY